MGLTLQFVVGDKHTIIEAIKDEDFDKLEDLENQNLIADFSLHITPNDLNFLVNSATELRQHPKFGLREFLDTTSHFFDSEWCGAYLVDSRISSLFSEFKITDALEITTIWFDKMRNEYKEDLDVNEDAIDAVKRLIEICKKATSLKLDLVHIWFA